MSKGIGAVVDTGDVVFRSIKNEPKCGGDRRLVIDGENAANAFHVPVQESAAFGPTKIRKADAGMGKQDTAVKLFPPYYSARFSLRKTGKISRSIIPTPL